MSVCVLIQEVGECLGTTQYGNQIGVLEEHEFMARRTMSQSQKVGAEVTTAGSHATLPAALGAVGHWECLATHCR